MKKLTEQRILEIIQEVHAAFYLGEHQSFERGLARAIEAEVLRINGDEVIVEREACAALCWRLYDEEMADGYECQQAILARSASPRATGCPDAMDETARFAADELPGILGKQAG